MATAAVARSATTISRALCGLAAMLGIPLDDVVRRHGLEAAQLDEVDRRVPAQLEMDLFDALAVRSGEPAAGLRVATMAAGVTVTFDLSDYVARNSPDLGTCIRNVLRYQRLLH